MTPKQQRFVLEYLIDLNATQAAIRAGYSEKTAYSSGQRLLKDVEIQAAIQEANNERSKKTEITAERVLQEYAKIAFFDPRKLFDRYGNPLPITDIDDDTAGAIAALDVDVHTDGETDLVTLTKKYRLADKQKALEALGRHLGILGTRISDAEIANSGVVLMPPVLQKPVDDDE